MTAWDVEARSRGAAQNREAKEQFVALEAASPCVSMRLGIPSLRDDKARATFISNATEGGVQAKDTRDWMRTRC